MMTDKRPNTITRPLLASLFFCIVGIGCNDPKPYTGIPSDGLSPIGNVKPSDSPSAGIQSLIMISGDAQSGIVKSVLNLPLKVRALDNLGGGVSGAVVNFSAGSGLLSSGAVITDPQGYAQATYAFPPESGARQITATATTQSGLATLFFNEAGKPGSAKDIVYSQGGNQSGVVNRTLDLPLIVKVVDSFGNPVPGASIVFLQSEGSLSALSGKTDQAGLLSTLFTLGTHSGLQSVIATASGLSGNQKVVISENAQPSIPKDIVFTSGDKQILPVNSPAPKPLAAQIVDSFGNGVPGIRVDWFAGDAATSSPFSVTSSSGIASVGFISSQSAGDKSVTASNLNLPGVKAVNFPYTGVAGTPSTVRIVSGDAQTAARLVASLPLQVLVTDLYLNGRPSVDVTWNIIFGGGSLDPSTPSITSTTTTDSNGNTALKYYNSSQIETATIRASISGGYKTEFSVTTKNFSPLTVKALTASGEPLEFSKLISSFVPISPVLALITPSGQGLVSDSGGVSATGGSSPLTGAAGAVTVKPAKVYDISVDGSVGITVSGTFLSEVSGGVCSASPDSASAFKSLLCSISMTPAVSILRSTITNAADFVTKGLKIRINSSGFGPLDYLDSASLGAKFFGIQKVTDLVSSVSDDIIDVVDFKGRLIFIAKNADGNYKLFSYDHSSSVKQLTDINPLASDFVATSHLSVDTRGTVSTDDDVLYFSATANNKLFSYDGSTIKQITNLSLDDKIGEIVPFLGQIFFTASGASNFSKLYRYDGVGVSQVSDIASGQSDLPRGLRVNDHGTAAFTDDELFFSANSAADASHVYRLDSTLNLTLASQPVAGDEFPAVLQPVGDSTAMILQDGSSGRSLVLKSASSLARIAQVSGLAGQIPSVTLAPYMYFPAYDSSSHSKLHRFSVQSGVEQVSSIQGSSDDLDSTITAGSQRSMAAYNGALYFVGYDSPGIKKLFKFSDGKVIKIASLNSSGSDEVGSLVQSGSYLYFSAEASPGVKKLYRVCDSSAGCL